MKRATATFLAILLLSLLPISAFAVEESSFSKSGGINVQEHIGFDMFSEEEIEGGGESGIVSENPDIDDGESSEGESESSIDPEPTAEPDPTPTPEPEETPEPTPTPEITPTPTPTPTPKPTPVGKPEKVSDLLETVKHNAYVKGSGGKFNPNQSLTRAETAQMFYGLLKNKKIERVEFKDVPSSAWYYNAVTRLAKLGIINGVSKTEFQPNRPITREEFVAIACRFAKMKTGKNIFKDVKSTRWSYKSIISAYSNGWLLGYTDGTFRPQNKITKAEAVTVINRMLNRKADSRVKEIGIVKRFSDVPTSFWAFAQISEAATTHQYTWKGKKEIWTVDENSTCSWVKVSNGYKCKSNLTGKNMTGFQEIGGQVYYFDKITGLLKSGWQKIDGKNYLLAAKDEKVMTTNINTLLTKVNYNEARRTWRSINYIAVHYTAVPGDTAQGEANAFYSSYQSASAHYFVDEKSTWQVVRDRDIAWHVGAPVYYHDLARNATSIGIEMCCKKTSTATKSSSDPDWYFHKNTETRTAELVRNLMKKYAIPMEHVIRHADVTHKVCPAPYVNTYSKWRNFLSLVTQKKVSYNGDYKAKLNGNATTYAGPGKNYKVVKSRKKNENIVVYDEKVMTRFADGRWVRIGTNEWVQIMYVCRTT